MDWRNGFTLVFHPLHACLQLGGSLRCTVPWLCSNLVWVVGNGLQVNVGMDAIKGVPRRPHISTPIITSLNQQGYSTLASIARALRRSCLPQFGHSKLIAIVSKRSSSHIFCNNGLTSFPIGESKMQWSLVKKAFT